MADVSRVDFIITARDQATRVFRDLNRSIGSVQSAFAALGVGLSAGAFVSSIKHVIESADQLDKLSTITGRSTASLSELKTAFHFGQAEIDPFAKGMRDFNRTLVEASDTSSKAGRLFKALGVDVLAGPDKAFRQFVDSFSKLPEGELRAAAAMEVMKKSGASWIPILAEGTKGLDDAAEKTRKFGIVVSSDFARQAKEFNDNLKLMGKARESFQMQIARHSLPALTEITKELANSGEKGHLLWGFMNEGAKLFYATVGRIFPSLEGMTQKAFDDLTRLTRETQGLGTQRVSGKIRYPSGPAAQDPGITPDPEAVRRALALTDQLQKRQIAALQQMEEKKRVLLSLSEEELMLQRVQTGTYKDFDAATVVRLLNMAVEIDWRKRDSEAIERHYGWFRKQTPCWLHRGIPE